MPVNPKRLLVISHAGNRTGAAIALLRIMTWCVQERLIEPVFILRRDGELVEDFRVLGPSFVVPERTERQVERALRALPGGGAAEAAAQEVYGRWLRRLCRRRRIELIYVNTATQARMASTLTPLGIPIVTHVHELNGQLQGVSDRSPLEQVIAQSDRLLAVSAAVRQMLLSRGADGDRVVEVQGPVDEALPLSNEARQSIRTRVLNVSDDALIVAACGDPSLRKGTDVFLRVAQQIIADNVSGRAIALRWIGGAAPNDMLEVLRDDVERLGLAAAVQSVGEVPYANTVFGAVDVLVSTSREDANPLVVLEAAAAGRPVVSFRDAGGAEELADAGGAVAVPYLDTSAMAGAVLRLLERPRERRLLGEAARQIVNRQNSPAVVGQGVLNVVRDLLDPQPSQPATTDRRKVLI